MAKKRKKKRHRQPVAPPVHSAPGTSHAPTAPRPPEPLQVRPVGAEPPELVADPVEDLGVVPRRRERARRPKASRRRRRSRRPMYIVAGIGLAIVAALVTQQVLGRRQASAFDRIASAGGCGKLEVTSDSGAGDHLAEGERTTYDSSPPTHGPHAGGRTAAAIYDEPFPADPFAANNIYLAVHSLEHGYVIVWHDGLSDEERAALERRYRGDKKVIVVPYPQLEDGTKMALTAWARKLECARADTNVVDAFIERFREARSAPERLQS